MSNSSLVLPLSQLRMHDVATVGGKNSSLGELISQLSKAGVRVPGGFARWRHARYMALANNMIRVDYTPLGDLTFTAVVVPIFRPAQLPRTAPLALLDPLRPPPIAEVDTARALDEGRQIYRVTNPACQNDQLARLQPQCNPLTVQADVLQPEISGRNTQFAFRAAYKLFGADVAVSYYRGLFGVPVPAWSVASGSLLNNQVRTAVVYPHVQVLGLEADRG